MLVLKKDIGSFLNKTSHLCVCRGLDCDGDCLPPTQLVFFVAQKKNLPASPKMAHLTGSQCQGPLCAPAIAVSVCFSIWTGSLAPAVPQPSPSLAHTSCLHPLSLLGVRFSGDWMQRRMRTSPLPLPCIARIRCPHLIFGKLTVSSWVGDEARGSRSGFF